MKSATLCVVVAVLAIGHPTSYADNKEPCKDEKGRAYDCALSKPAPGEAATAGVCKNSSGCGTKRCCTTGTDGKCYCDDCCIGAAKPSAAANPEAAKLAVTLHKALSDAAKKGVRGKSVQIELTESKQGVAAEQAGPQAITCKVCGVIRVCCTWDEGHNCCDDNKAAGIETAVTCCSGACNCKQAKNCCSGTSCRSNGDCR